MVQTAGMLVYLVALNEGDNHMGQPQQQLSLKEGWPSGLRRWVPKHVGSARMGSNPASDSFDSNQN